MADMNSAGKPRSRLFRVLRGIGLASGVATLVLSFAVGGALLWLRRPQGQDFLQRHLLEVLKTTLAGRVEIDRLQISGLLRVEADAVRLYAPTGAVPAISTRHVVVEVRATALLRRRIEVQTLQVDSPVLHIVQEGPSTNLERALASPHPSPGDAAKPAAPPHFWLEAPVLQLRNASLDLDGPSPLGAKAMDLDLSVFGYLDDLAVSASLHGTMTQPVERMLAVTLRGRLDTLGAKLDALAVAIGASQLVATGSLKFDLSRAQLDLQTLRLAATDVNDFVPQAHLAADVTLAGC
jgi:uncharacterized protein involved in outer membrane biogenesis